MGFLKFNTPKQTLFFSLFALLFCGNLSGQIADTTLDGSLSEILISATRSEQAAAKTPRNVTVITAEQFQKLPYSNVGELLTREAGIYVVGAGQNNGQVQAMFMRGAGRNQTAVFVDGVRVYDAAASDGAVDLTEISLLDVAQVEIVRGSHSAVFGAGAVGGMVNIVTKKAPKLGLHGSVGALGGNFGNQKSPLSHAVIGGGPEAQISYGFQNGVYASTGFYYRNVPGMDATQDTNTAAASLPRDIDGFEKKDFFVKTGINKEQIRAAIGYRKAHQKTDIDDGAFRDDDNYTTDFQRDIISYNVNYTPKAKWQIGLSGGFTNMLRRDRDDSTFIAPGVSDAAISTGRYTGQTFQNDLLAQYDLGKQQIKLGVFQTRETMNAQTTYYQNGPWGAFEFNSDLDSLDLKAEVSGIYGHAHFMPKYKFGFDLAARLAYHNQFGNVFTWSLNPFYEISENAMFFAALTSGFNAPTLYQLYSPDADWVSGITRGNPDLKPERSFSVEIGYKQNTAALDWSVSLFQNELNDQIQYVYLWIESARPDTFSYLDYRGDTYLNNGKQTVFGTELSLDWRINKHFSLGGQYSYIKGKIDAGNLEENPHTSGVQAQLFESGAYLNKSVNINALARRPQTANLYLKYSPKSNLQLRLDGFYAGERKDVFYDYSLGAFGALGTTPVDAYFLTHFSAAWQINSAFSLAARLENLTDKKYSEILGYNTRGRSYYLLGRYSF